MTFVNVPSGATIFLDANTLIYHFTNHARYGSACTQLIKRVELRGVQGFTSAHVLADVAHRLMTTGRSDAAADRPLRSLRAEAADDPEAVASFPDGPYVESNGGNGARTSGRRNLRSRFDNSSA